MEGGGIFCVDCLKAGEEVIQLIQQRGQVVAGLQRGCDGLEPTPLVPGISAVVEAVSQPPVVLSPGLSDAK